MCNFKTLYYGEDGYLIVCNECLHFQLAFQTTLLTLTAADLKVLHSIVKEKYEYSFFEPATVRKNIYIPTPLEGYGIIMTRNELERLHDLLEIAEVNYKTSGLLELFNSN